MMTNKEVKAALVRLNEAEHSLNMEWNTSNQSFINRRMEIERKGRDVQDQCEHTAKKHWSDPAGDSGETTCLICGKVL